VPLFRVNLTVASIVHLIEPHWNPMVEAQAVDRVYRIGQTQEVTVFRYIVPNSVETVSGLFWPIV
jgi:SNF2 family DNA or RNA helicase